MLQKTDSVDRLRIASPCPTSWESMKGDNRVRFCELCKLNVYDISELTKKQAAELIASKEGRLCARLHRRADGTVITKDCPVGLRAIRRRVSRMAGATMTAVLSFCFGVMGQNRSQEDELCPGDKRVMVSRESSVQGEAKREPLSGVIKDPNGAAVAGAVIELVNHATKKIVAATTNDEGFFKIHALEAGSYRLEVFASGFSILKFKKLDVQADEVVSVDIILQADEGDVTVNVGGAIGDSLVDTNTGIKTTFSPNKITKLPF